MENELRSGLMASGGSYLALFDRPVAVFFLCVAVIMLFYPAVLARIRRRSPATAAG
jgi:TctA family transporter